MIIAPSVLSLDYTDTKKQIEELNESGAQWMHFDVMDGHFVPNISFGPDILKAFNRISPLFKDVHLMCSNPSFASDLFLQAGADLITVHEEAGSEDEIHAIAAKIHEKGVKAGLAIRPSTSVETLKPFLKEFDLFLIMSVEPGFGGQSFMPASLERIRAVRKWLDDEKIPAHIEVDGGINGTTGPQCLQAGADVLVAGSYIFRNNMKEAVMSLCGHV